MKRRNERRPWQIHIPGRWPLRTRHVPSTLPIGTQLTVTVPGEAGQFRLPLRIVSIDPATYTFTAENA